MINILIIHKVSMKLHLSTLLELHEKCNLSIPLNVILFTGLYMLG